MALHKIPRMPSTSLERLSSAVVSFVCLTTQLTAQEWQLGAGSQPAGRWTPYVTLAQPADALGVTRLELAVPTTASLLGSNFFVQGIALQPGPNSLGLAFCRGFDETVGH